MEQEIKKKPVPTGKKKKVKKKVIKKKTAPKYNIHLIFFAVVIVLFIFAIAKFLIWNKGKTADTWFCKNLTFT